MGERKKSGPKPGAKLGREHALVVERFSDDLRYRLKLLAARREQYFFQILDQAVRLGLEILEAKDQLRKPRN